MRRIGIASDDNGTRGLLLFPRVLLLMVMVPHGTGKFNAPTAFSERFDLPMAVTLAGGTVEILAGLLVALGAVLHGLRGVAATWVGVAFTLIIQVSAIVIAHPSDFFYFAPGGGGMEYNLVLIGLCLMLLFGTVQLDERHTEGA